MMSQSEKLQNKYTFTSPSFHSEFIRIMLVITDKQKGGKKFIETEAQNYQVTDQMTIKQLKQKWHKNNKLSKGLNQYVFMWNLKYVLKDEYTIQKIKQMVGLTKFDDKCIFKVCDEWDCHLKQDGSSLDYGAFIQKNQYKYDITFKILTTDYKDTRYFYLPCRLDSTLQNLKQYIVKYFSSNYQKQNIKYRLFMKKTSATHQFNQLYKNDSTLKQNLRETEYNFDFTDCQLDQVGNKLLIVRILTVGHTVQIRFDKELDLPINTPQNSNPDIRITYFQKEKRRNSNMIKRKEFINKFSEIHELRVETLLFEESIENAHFTSLYSGSCILKPEQKFQKLASFPNFQKEDIISLILIPDDLLYYKQIFQLQKSQKVLNLEEIFEIVAENTKQFYSQDPKYKPEIPIKDRVLMHLHDLTQEIEREIKIQQHKNQQFLKPIVLYTSDYIYQDFNQYLRNNSISRILSPIFDKNSWYYPFCEKLMQSLLKLPNFQGIVYRASTNSGYQYKQGEIMAWKGFTSTQKQLIYGLYLFSSEYSESAIPYLFQIQSYSGKQITQFLAEPGRTEVIFLPYTRFKVLQVRRDYELKIKQINQRVTFVKLLEIPVPKRFPGNIVVWIDNKIQQNFYTFQDIVKQNKLTDFDLIQLVDNNHFKDWLQQYRSVLLIKEIKIHFISGMNRPPYFNLQGIQTLQIIRNFSQEALMIYYIGNIQRAKTILKARGKDQDQNLQVCDTKAKLSKIFAKNFKENK